jgi:hypothetical protein
MKFMRQAGFLSLALTEALIVTIVINLKTLLDSMSLVLIVLIVTELSICLLKILNMLKPDFQRSVQSVIL